MKTALLGIVATVLMAAGCNNAPSGDQGRVPNPPFIGAAPEEAYIYEGEPGVYGGELVLAQPSDPKTFNPITASGTNTTHPIHVHVFRCLVEYRNGEDPPRYDAGLCTKWEQSADAREWTFYLRRGVLWSDGQPFTADDVVFTYEVLRDPNVDNPLRDTFKEGIDENDNDIYPDINKIDDHTVRFTLHSPNGAFLDAIYNLWLIPRHKWETVWRSGKFNEAMKLSDDPSGVVSLGPFRIKEYVTGQRIVLERNPYFWKVDKEGRRLPYLDRVVWVIAQNFDTILSKFQGGELDGMWRVRANEYALVKRMENDQVVVQETGISYDQNWIAFNLNTGVDSKTGKSYVTPWKQRLFRDQRFRQAVSYAIDRQGIAETIYFGRAVPVYSFITPGDKIYRGKAMSYNYNPDRARQLLAEIGLSDTNGDGVLEDVEGHKIEITIIAFTGNAVRTETAQIVAASLKKVGVSAKIEPIPFNILLNRTENTFDFDVAVGAWQSGTPPTPINTKNILLSSGAQHVCFPKQKTPSTEWEAEIDRLVHQVVASPDAEERKRLYAEVDRIWSEQLPEINLVAEKYAVTYRTRFRNIRPSPLFAHMTWNCEEIYVRE